MKRIAALAAIPLFAGYLFAQTQSTQTTTTTTTTNYSGTLLDAGCYTTHTHQKDTTTGEASTTTTETNKVATNCPVTDQTTSYGLMTPEGRYIAFDDAGNQKVVEVMKSNKSWHSFVSEHKPVKVRVIGTMDGDRIVIKEIK